MFLRSFFALALSGLFLLPAPAQAELCSIDAVPAATLLLPYFEVDLADPEGINTVFSVNNASSTPTIAHVVLWTDWSQPVLDFDLFLTGYDVQTVNLYEVLANGNLPVTADEQSDPLDTISPHADHPEWDGSFPQTPAAGSVDCAEIFPLFINPILQGTRLADLQAKLTGQSIDGACFGADHGDGLARGYVTVDSADTCSLLFQNDPDYFSDGVNPAIANNNNVLWGDYFLITSNEDFASGDNLVHVEAVDTPDWPSGYTFYSRYSVPAGTIDGREPLGNVWAIRHLNKVTEDKGFDGGTRLYVWRDSTVLDIDEAGYTCGAPGALDVGPAWAPLNETRVLAFDEQEQAEELCGIIFGDGGPPVSPPDVPLDVDPVCFPLETQCVDVQDEPLLPSFDFGWLYLDLNIDDVLPMPGPFDLDLGLDGNLAQSYVSSTRSALGRFSAGLAAVELSSACQVTIPEIAW